MSPMPTYPREKGFAIGLLHAVDAHRVVVEKIAALGGREAARRLVEAGVDSLEAVAQAVDRVVAREHRAPRAEELDHREHDLALRGGIQVAESGNLHHHVWAAGELGHGRAPAGHVWRR